MTRSRTLKNGHTLRVVDCAALNAQQETTREVSQLQKQLAMLLTDVSIAIGLNASNLSALGEVKDPSAKILDIIDRSQMIQWHLRSFEFTLTTLIKQEEVNGSK